MNLIILFKEDFTQPNRVALQGRRLDHIRAVHRAEVGDLLPVGLLNKKIGSGKILSIKNDSIEMEVALSADPPAPLNLNLILAMPRPKALKRIIQHATAMGVKKIYIIKTWKVEKSFWSTPILEEKNLFEQKILGLEQAVDTVLPEIHIRKLFKPFVEDEVPSIIEGTRALVAHPGSKAYCPHNVNKKITIAIGPDGGFIPYEVEMLINHGFESITLGKRILRVETAVPYLIGKLFL